MKINIRILVSILLCALLTLSGCGAQDVTAQTDPAAGTDTPSVMVNSLIKGKVRYAIVHRLPDSFRPQAPKLDRKELASRPSLSLCQRPC